jgi:hypothetical protein
MDRTGFPGFAGNDGGGLDSKYCQDLNSMRLSRFARTGARYKRIFFSASLNFEAKTIFMVSASPNHFNSINVEMMDRSSVLAQLAHAISAIQKSTDRGTPTARSDLLDITLVDFFPSAV